MPQQQAKSPLHGTEYGASAGAGRAAPYPPALKPGGYGASTAPARAGTPKYGAKYGAPQDVEIDTQYVTWRLEEAGRALLALPHTGHSPRLRTSSYAIVHLAMEAYGWGEQRLRPPVPSAPMIDRMDQAYAWLALIPDEKYVLRRIVAVRSLVHPLTDRHLYPWRRLGAALGADHKAVQRWWGQGVALIVRGLAAP